MLDEVLEKWRMQINWKKTKVLTVKQGGDTSDIAVKGVRALFAEGSCDEGIENRMGAAIKVIRAMRSEVEKRTEQGYEVEDIQCNDGAYFTVRV